MAIFGISASCNGNASEEFVRRGIACTYHTRTEDPGSYATLHQFHRGDIVFIKTYTPYEGLKAKAVGIVASPPLTQPGLDTCIPVQWVWQGEQAIEVVDDTCPLRGNEVYEELNILAQREILDLLPPGCRLPDIWAGDSQQDEHGPAA